MVDIDWCSSTSSPEQLSHYESSNNTMKTAAYLRFNFLCVVPFDWRHVTKIKWQHFVHRMDWETNNGKIVFPDIIDYIYILGV